MASQRPAPVLLGLDPSFPAPERALAAPNGLLAIGGDLTTPRLLNAYRAGIFPWYGEGDPILWWSPDPRAVIVPDKLYIASRFTRFLRRCSWTLTLNHAFWPVVQACAAAPRAGQPGTWLTRDMQKAYYRLHQEGHAHSVEVWDGKELIGGIYGLAIGEMVYGESMFSRRSNSSKVALTALCQHMRRHGLDLLDCQVANPHTLSLGAVEWERSVFLNALKQRIARPCPVGAWQAQDLPPAAELAERPAPSTCSTPETP